MSSNMFIEKKRRENSFISIKFYSAEDGLNNKIYYKEYYHRFYHHYPPKKMCVSTLFFS